MTPSSVTNVPTTSFLIFLLFLLSSVCKAFLLRRVELVLFAGRWAFAFADPRQQCVEQMSRLRWCEVAVAICLDKPRNEQIRRSDKRRRDFVSSDIAPEYQLVVCCMQGHDRIGGASGRRGVRSKIVTCGGICGVTLYQPIKAHIIAKAKVYPVAVIERFAARALFQFPDNRLHSLGSWGRY